MSFAINQFTGFGVASSLVPPASNAWDFMTQSLVDTIDGATLTFKRDNDPPVNTNSWYWDSNLDYVTDGDSTSPRWEYYPADLGDASAGDERGLLIEGTGHDTAATALVNDNNYSYELNSNSQWAETRISFTTGQASPDGNNRALKHTATVTSGTHLNYGGNRSLTGATIGQGVCVQIHYKNVHANQRYFMMELTAGTSGGSVYRAVIDTIDHTVVDSSSSGGTGNAILFAGTVPVADGYHNAVLSGVLTGNTTCQFRYYMGDGDTIADHTGAWAGAGDDTTAMLFWNCMLSYRGAAHNHKLCSVGDTGSRGDGCRIATSDLNGFNNDAGTLWLEVEWPEECQQDNAYMMGIGDGANTDYIALACARQDASSNPRHWAWIRENNAAQTANVEDLVDPTTSTIHRFAITWDRDTSTMQSAYDGAASTQQTSYSVPTSDHLDYLYVGRLPSGDLTTLMGQGIGKFWIRKARYYNTALTEGELKAITTL